MNSIDTRARAVVVSAAVLHSAAETLKEYDEFLRAGRSALVAGCPDPRSAEEIPSSNLNGFDVRQWAERHLPDAEDARRRLRRAAARATLPVRTAACVAMAAVRAARLTPKERANLILLVAGNNLSLAHHAAAVLEYNRDVRTVRARHLLDCLDTDTVGAVSEAVGVHAEGWTVGSASASGTTALIQGVRLIEAGFTEHCLVVAPATDLSPVEIAALRLSGALAAVGDETPEAACRPFDADRSGFAYGCGAAAVVLEAPREHSRAHAPAPLGYVLGHGQYLDGRRGTAPDVEGQCTAMRLALASARLAPENIDYVNAHGTGSVLGDEVESRALHTVFGDSDSPWTNSTKGLIGHCLSAAGLLEAVATLLQLNGGYCHASPWLRRPVRPGPRFTGREPALLPLRTAMSNSFAFSGINSSVVLGRATGKERS
ncbi:beta-ketoacyl synthase N-terminal-like domain-containing protein [Streptomyces shenzhenensis]|uniref:beta-ketoacyl synthase N-terminal-like domain-containing protein n=1 Tax=Streptomyces shenzhenensis TaxID=943815 RepID=UPI0033C89DF8